MENEKEEKQKRKEEIKKRKEEKQKENFLKEEGIIKENSPKIKNKTLLESIEYFYYNKNNLMLKVKRRMTTKVLN